MLHAIPYAAAAFLYLPWLLVRRRHSFNIVHCFSATLLSLCAVGLAKLLKKKVMIEMTLLGDDDPSSLRKGRGGLSPRIRRWLFGKADIVVGISPALTAAYLSSGLPERKLRLVPNPVDVDLYSPPSEEERSALRAKLGLAGSFPVVLHVGAVIKRKGVDVLAEAFLKIAAHYPKAMLVMVGPCLHVSDAVKLAPRIGRMAAAAGIGDRVVFTGQVDNVDEYMKASDVLVLASRKEGLPNVVLEAMASGLPVVASRLPGITDYLIDDGRNGRVVEEENPDELAAAVIDLSQDEAACKDIARRARETAVTRFAPDVIDKQYEAVYDELMEPV